MVAASLPYFLTSILTGLPASAAPRLTLRLENATLEETLGRLRQFYGVAITAPAGYQGMSRGSFRWQEAGIGTVLRDVGTQFRLRVRTLADGSFSLEAGASPPAALTATREGVAITLRTVHQREARTQTASSSLEQSALTLTLVLESRLLDGDPEPLYALTNFKARDDRGREFTAPEVRRKPNAGTGFFPDEWRAEAVFTGYTPGARALESVTGEVVLYREAATHRLEIPVETWTDNRERTAGPVRLRSLEVAGTCRRPQGRCFLAWPRGVEVPGTTEGESAGVALFARGRGGGLYRLPVSFGGLSVDETGEHSAQLTFRTPADLPEEPVALVWDLTTRSQPERRIPFRFGRLPLPLAPEGADTSLASAVLLSLLADLARPGELTVGVSRQQGKGWGPVRWLTVEADARGEARLEGLAPGVYRLRGTFRPRDSRGHLAGAVPLKPVTLTLPRGGGARASLAR